MTDHDARQAGLTDDFRGNTPALIRSIEALISLSDEGALVPHGIGGHARGLLSAAAVRLAAPSADARNGEAVALAQEMRWRDVSVEKPTQAQQVLFVRNGKVHFGAWINDIFWYSNEKVCALYWMPLPEAPTLVAPAAPAPKDAEILQIIDERDAYHEIADDLAAQIAAITDVEIGEHSSVNDPWRNAMLAADDFIAKQLRKLLAGPSAPAPAAQADDDLAAFAELIDDYQCAQKDGSVDDRAQARIALLNAYRDARQQSVTSEGGDHD